jgi:hypothetical protein
VNYKGKCTEHVEEADKIMEEAENVGDTTGGDDNKNKGDSDEGSEDSGPYFGTWKPTEIQKIAKMQISEERTVALNEYGSNLIKYKYDPLQLLRQSLH